MRQIVPSRLRHRLDALDFTAIPSRQRGTTDAATPEVLLALSGAIRAQETLRFDYASLGSDPDRQLTPPRRVEPHHIVTANERWYLVAWDLDRGEWRIFRVDRVSPRTPTGPRFTPREVPGGSVREYISARFRGSEKNDAWPCRGTVVLHLSAPEVLPFAGDGMVEDLGPNRCSLEAGSWSWTALAASFGRFDTEIEVVGPPQLAAAFDQLASRFASTVASARSGGSFDSDVVSLK